MTRGGRNRDTGNAQPSPKPQNDPPAPAQSSDGPKLPELGDKVLLTVREEHPETGEHRMVGPYPGTIVTVTDGSYFADVLVAEDGIPEWTARHVNHKGEPDHSYWEHAA